MGSSNQQGMCPAPSTSAFSFVTFLRPDRTIAAESSQRCQERKNDVLNNKRRLHWTKFLAILLQDDCKLQEVWQPGFVGLACLSESPHDFKEVICVQSRSRLPEETCLRAASIPHLMCSASRNTKAFACFIPFFLTIDPRLDTASLHLEVFLLLRMDMLRWRIRAGPIE